MRLRNYLKPIIYGCVTAVAWLNLGATAPSPKPEQNKLVIILDAGHGGGDTGCRYGGANEKDVTLNVVLGLQKMLRDSLPTATIILTRNSDVFVELFERAAIANRNKADLFISVHCNASPNATAYGTETYAMGLHKTQGNLETAKRENASILLESDYQNNYDGFDPNAPESHIIFSIFQNAFMAQSLDLAARMESSFKMQNRYSRGVKQAGFLVLWKTAMPSILIETGYLSNAKERSYLTSTEGQTELVTGIYSALRGYLKDNKLAN